MPETSETQAPESAPESGSESEAGAETPAIDRRLLDLLVCPVSLGPLRYDRGRDELVSEKASLAYPIREGIPIMLEDEARVIEE